ncbi:probable calcium-binding protein CML15 [Camellia sinensis]|uniref:EF-hand domain-containing protein n=1 Tax=Camellia sinensis var. sinensis TaxID=542762 RepID=A0A4S4DZA8_CAMSN|nr:probable calcium-binding protein CML15 [Camellia sinensis]THG08799.1 hypothetical protein TEA_009704 [Camellia sinensis var. sinensis]
MISLPKYNHQNLLLLLPTTTINPTTLLLLRLLLCDHLHPTTTTTTTIIMSVVFEVNQLDQLRDIFSRFDMDSDGSLTLLELAALLRSLGIKPSGDQIHVLLANMDANGNGTVEFDELVNAITPHMTEDLLINQGQLLEVFKSFDRDGNGYITLAELAGSMAKMGQPLTYKELTEMIKEADTDGDGVISFNEFASIMAKSAADIFGFPVS